MTIFGTSKVASVAVQFTKNKVGQISLAGVTAKVVNPSGSVVSSGDVTLSEVDTTNLPGVWKVSVAVAGTAVEGEYLVNVHTTDTTVDRQDLGATFYCYAWVNYIDVAISSRTSAALSAAQLTVQSPIIDSDSLTMEQGDGYYSTEGRQFIFTYTGGISLSGATVILRIDQVSVSGVVAGSVPAQTVTFQPTEAQTASLASGIHRYKVRATLSNGHVVTLGRGTVDIGADT